MLCYAYLVRSFLKTTARINSPLPDRIYVKFPKNNRKLLISGRKNRVCMLRPNLVIVVVYVLFAVFCCYRVD
jgi:hypothetical protein